MVVKNNQCCLNVESISKRDKCDWKLSYLNSGRGDYVRTPSCVEMWCIRRLSVLNFFLQHFMHCEFCGYFCRSGCCHWALALGCNERAKVMSRSLYFHLLIWLSLYAWFLSTCPWLVCLSFVVGLLVIHSQKPMFGHEKGVCHNEDLLAKHDIHLHIYVKFLENLHSINNAYYNSLIMQVFHSHTSKTYFMSKQYLLNQSQGDRHK